MKDSLFLKDHRALITGASSGIGAEYARQLASLGADLVLAARRQDRLEDLAKELRTQYSVHVDCIQVDLAVPGSVQKLFHQATQNKKNVTLLINNAGLGKYGAFVDFNYEDHQSTLSVNTVALTELTYLFVKHMLAHGKKSYITQIASIAAFQPVSYFTVYSATKAYVRVFSETLAFELKNTNVKVFCLCPGGVVTEFFEQAGQKITARGEMTMMMPQDVVHLGIKAMLKGKTVFVPGILNKIACFLPRLLPRKLALGLAFKTMNQAVEKIG